MEELIVVEISLDDWVGLTASSLYYHRDVLRLEALDAVKYCWGRLDADGGLTALSTKYLDEYTNYIADHIKDYISGAVDVDLLNDIFKDVIEYFHSFLSISCSLFFCSSFKSNSL